MPLLFIYMPCQICGKETAFPHSHCKTNQQPGNKMKTKHEPDTRCYPNALPPITPIEMTEADIELAEQAAKRIGYSQTAYTSTSGLWGVFCLPENSRHKSGCFIKTKEFGLLFVSDLKDLKLHDLNVNQHAYKSVDV